MGSGGDRLCQTRLIPRSPDGDKKQQVHISSLVWVISFQRRNSKLVPQVSYLQILIDLRDEEDVL